MEKITDPNPKKEREKEEEVKSKVKPEQKQLVSELSEKHLKLLTLEM
jgi:hypothetical protein